MNRCLLSLALACSFVLALHGGAAAQTPAQRIPPMKADAINGTMTITLPPEITMDGKPARLSPGARIRNRNNLLVLSGSLAGQTLAVRYLRDTLGLVSEVWILTDAEIQAFNPPVPPPTATP